ncbi:MAG: hypothetical protein OXG92_13200 [Chloroflexi bacterium]|nr:hypothetical protein [Chloroflexota bacterium]MCY3582611.1 hypothetical protein [Chloroflexota bacterium]MCY3717406.1 hypothetical protein [Chloroflexota bacterium]MDE2649846.1 hypothetical protein [Chloroflexota bacterium]MXV92176.1 hypothetical protein [Chloroflexota bacterium]
MECLLILLALAALPIVAVIVAKLLAIGVALASLAFGVMLAIFGLTLCAALVSVFLGVPM